MVPPWADAERIKWFDAYRDQRELDKGRYTIFATNDREQAIK
jgi:hypothetical protein